MSVTTEDVRPTRREVFVKWRNLLHDRYRQLESRIGSSEGFDELIVHLESAKEVVELELLAAKSATDLGYVQRRARIEQAEGKIRSLTRFILETKHMSTAPVHGVE